MKKTKDRLREEFSENSNILYSAVVLDKKSKDELLSTYKNEIPDGWKTIAHHMTIAFGGPAPKEDVGNTVCLTVKKIGVSDMAIAVQVDGYQSKNKIPHITLAINPDGGKPVMSNNITNWKSTESLKVCGVVTNITK